MLNPAIAQQHNAVRQGHGFDLVMGHVDHCPPKFLVQALDLSAHVVAQLRIEITQGFIKQEQARFTDDGTANGNPLALATRQLAWIAFEQGFYAQHACRDIYPRNNFIFRCFFRPQGKSDILFNCHVRVERIVLEHHGHVAVARPHIVDDIAINGNGSARYVFKACDHAQQRALAAA